MLHACQCMGCQMQELLFLHHPEWSTQAQVLCHLHPGPAAKPPFSPPPHSSTPPPAAHPCHLSTANRSSKAVSTRHNSSRPKCMAASLLECPAPLALGANPGLCHLVRSLTHKPTHPLTQLLTYTCSCTTHSVINAWRWACPVIPVG